MSNDEPNLRPTGGYASGRPLTDHERGLLLKDHLRTSAPGVDAGKRAVQADSASTVVGYLRELRGISVEAAAKRAGVTVAELQQLESGGSTVLMPREEAGLKRVFGRPVNELTRSLDDEGVKAAALHGLPMPLKERQS